MRGAKHVQIYLSFYANAVLLVLNFSIRLACKQRDLHIESTTTSQWTKTKPSQTNRANERASNRTHTNVSQQFRNDDLSAQNKCCRFCSALLLCCYFFLLSSLSYSFVSFLSFCFLSFILCVLPLSQYTNTGFSLSF